MISIDVESPAMVPSGNPITFKSHDGDFSEVFTPEFSNLYTRFRISLSDNTTLSKVFRQGADVTSEFQHDALDSSIYHWIGGDIQAGRITGIRVLVDIGDDIQSISLYVESMNLVSSGDPIIFRSSAGDFPGVFTPTFSSIATRFRIMIPSDTSLSKVYHSGRDITDQFEVDEFDSQIYHWVGGSLDGGVINDLHVSLAPSSFSALIPLSEVRDRLRLEPGNPSNATLESMLSEAASIIENKLDIAIVKDLSAVDTRTHFPYQWEPSSLFFKGFNAKVSGISYIDRTTQARMSVSGFRLVDDTRLRGDKYILPPSDGWPLYKAEPGSIRVSGSRGVRAGSLPKPIKGAILIVCAKIWDGAYDPDPDPAVDSRVSPYERVVF